MAFHFMFKMLDTQCETAHALYPEHESWMKPRCPECQLGRDVCAVKLFTNIGNILVLLD